MGHAVIFPGQGTQSPGMGADWVPHPAWHLVAEAEAVVGRSLAPLLLDASAEELRRTENAQMSVFLVSMMAWDSLAGVLEGEVAFAGHSLGQVSALVAAGCLSFAEGVRLVESRAAFTQAAADDQPGAMAALIGATPVQAADACGAAPGACWVANDNAPGQLVIGGTPEGVEQAQARASELGVRRVVKLEVGGAFHTPLMAPAATRLRPVLDGIDFRAPRSPVVANTDAAAHSDGAHSGGDWAERLERHLVSPVRWRESLLTLAGLGATSLVEVGPGAVLAGLARRTVPDLVTRGVSAPSDVSELLEAELLEVV